MRIPKQPAMDSAGRQLVSQAVAAAEAKTSGEIVTILAQQSDEYRDVALAWSAAVALLALVVLANFSGFYLALWGHLTGGWVQEWHPGEILGMAAVVAGLKFLGMWLILLWRRLRLFLVPVWVKQHRVRTHAVSLFKVGAERRTAGRTGILIYLSLAERRAEIVADTAIAAKVAPEVWGAALAALLSGIKAGQMAEGLAAAVAQVGLVLAEHFPRDRDDKNEIPDGLIEL
jgi:putative membrane protein